MKKAFIFFLIFGIFACALFFIGYGARRVEPGEFGVLISKTNGIDEKPIMNGDKDWKWQFLLPTNTEVVKFKIEPVNFTKTVSGELPSGSLYASLFEVTGNFNYKFTFSMSLTVSPENVIQLLKENIISNNKDLNEYLSMAGDSIAQLAANYYLNRASKDSSFRPESVRRSQVTKSMGLEEDFPFVDLSVFSLTECIIPDFKLYEELQDQGIVVLKDLQINVKNMASSDNDESNSAVNLEESDKEGTL